MKKALLVVSFGTTFHDTLEKNIAAIERDLAAAFPDRDLCRAFTSGMIIRRLRERDGIAVDNTQEALERLAQMGYTDVVLQSTHVMNGEERDKMMAHALPFVERFQSLTFGAPLLTDTRFYLCGASYVLNLQHVVGVREREATLDNGVRLTLPRACAAPFRTAWSDFWIAGRDEYPQPADG